MRNHRFLLRTFIAVTISILIISDAETQVVINEYSCGNKSQHADATGGYEDWVELYNTGATSANIGGFHLSDQK